MSSITSIRDLLRNMNDASFPVELLLWPLDNEGFHIPFVCSYKYQASIQRGHLLERIMELLILTGISPYGKIKCFEGKIGEHKEITNINSYLDGKINKGSSNGVSDITFEKDEILYLISCKFYEDEKSIDKYDIEKIYTDVRGVCNMSEEKFKIGLCIHDKKIFSDRFSKTRNRAGVKYIDPSNVFDVKDVYKMIRKLRHMNVVDTNILFNPKAHLNLHIHQEIISKTIFNKIKNYKRSLDPSDQKILLGAIPRSGKSFIVGGAINFMRKGRFLLFTTRINETSSGFMDDLFEKYDNFSSYEIVRLSRLNGGSHDKDCIHLTSKKYLERLVSDDNDIKKYDIIFIDEAHEGGSTELCKEIIDKYSHGSTSIVYITATYKKPSVLNDISSSNCIFWTLEDVYNLSNGCVSPLEKFDVYKDYIQIKGLSRIDSLSQITGNDIQTYFKSIPRLVFMTNQFTHSEENKKLLETCGDRELGLSMRSLFYPTTRGDASHPNELKLLISMISGNGLDLFKKRQAFIPRIRSHSQKYSGRSDGFLGLMFFLPSGEGEKINVVSRMFIKLLESDRVLKKYAIVNMDEFKGGEYVRKLKGVYEKSKRDNKSGIIIVTCEKCALGVSLPFIDAVFLFNSLKSGDKIYQMMFRCLTEDVEKYHGYVIDMNPMRVLESILTYFPRKETVSDTIRHLTSNIIEIDSDLFETKIIDREIVINTFTNLWKEKMFNHDIIEEIVDSEFLLGENIIFSDLLNYNKLYNINSKTVVNKIDSGMELQIEEKEKEEVEEEEKEEKETEEDDKEKEKDLISDEKKRMKTRDVLAASIVLLSILTMNEKSEDMENLITLVNKKAFENKLETIFGYKISFSTSVKIIKDNIKHIRNSLCMLKQDLISNIDNKKKLLTYITSKLAPREQEKRLNGEVFTPIEFIEEKMLDRLEEETPGLFSKKNYKWLDPCNGIGNFPICIYYRLMEGLKTKIKDEERRRKHIIEKMLYVCEIDETNIDIYKQIMKGEDYKLNIYTGDFMEFEPEYFDLESFDVVIGNPPYQKNTKEGSYGSSLPFYNDFIDHGCDMSEIVMFVTPSRWFSGGKGLDKFRKKMLSKKTIRVIDHYTNSKDVFSMVNIEGGVNVLFIDSSYNGECKFISKNLKTLVNLSDYDVISDPKYIVLVKFFNETNKLSSIFKTRGLYKLETNDKRLHEKSLNSIKCYVSQMKGFIKYVDKKDVNTYETNKYYKVITPEANGRCKNFGNIFTSTPDEVYTNSYISFVTDNNEESESLMSYMKCKLPNVMLGLRKISQHISEKTCKWIPIVPFDRVWTDEEVNKHFNIPNNLISLVDEYVKEYKVSLKDKDSKKIKESKSKENQVEIEFDEINLVYPDGTIKEVDGKGLSKFTVVELKKIAFNNNINLSSKQTKPLIIKKLLGYQELSVE